MARLTALREQPDVPLNRGMAALETLQSIPELAGELVNYRIDGFQAWRFQDEDGRWRMLRDHA